MLLRWRAFTRLDKNELVVEEESEAAMANLSLVLHRKNGDRGSSDPTKQQTTEEAA